MSDFAKELSDMMTSYDTARAKWIADNGSDAGFDGFVLREIENRSNLLSRLGVDGDEGIDLSRLSKWDNASREAK